MFVSVNEDGVIRAASSKPIRVQNLTTLRAPGLNGLDQRSLLGKRVAYGEFKDSRSLRVAFICNWGERCGIATYTKLLIDALRPLVKEIKIFAEQTDADTTNDPQDNCVRTWKRGESLISTIQQVLAWKPDFVHVQHEFGIFPKATHFLKMLDCLQNTPYVITTHSVYEHLDKSVCTACIKNTIVHSHEAKRSLERLGHLNKLFVIGHGCVTYPDISELWNIFHNDYTVLQFGFGFNYKGVDLAIDAINLLQKSDPKFKNLFYCYLASENSHTKAIHEEYYSYLKKKIQEYELADNVVILRGFLSEKVIGNFLRTAKLAIFPYRNDPNNCVYGASGAIRNAMANGIPIIASDSHLFDDLEGIVPRITDHLGLSQEIDRVFSDGDYRKELIQRNLQFVQDNNWCQTAHKHLAVYRQILDEFETQMIRIGPYEIFSSVEPALQS